jgi:hypothetical protein
VFVKVVFGGGWLFGIIGLVLGVGTLVFRRSMARTMARERNESVREFPISRFVFRKSSLTEPGSGGSCSAWESSGRPSVWGRSRTRSSGPRGPLVPGKVPASPRGLARTAEASRSIGTIGVSLAHGLGALGGGL